MTNSAKLVLITILINGLAGCAAPTKDTLLPQNGPTMEDVYRSQQLRVGQEQNKFHQQSVPKHLTRSIHSGDVDLRGYTRNASNEINEIFPRLPNPTLVMYIYPHLSTSSRLPVPGYSTSFTMYESAEYALPGED